MCMLKGINCRVVVMGKKLKQPRYLSLVEGYLLWESDSNVGRHTVLHSPSPHMSHMVQPGSSEMGCLASAKKTLITCPKACAPIPSILPKCTTISQNFYEPCIWVELCPPEKYAEVLTPIPGRVTLFGNRSLRTQASEGM